MEFSRAQLHSLGGSMLEKDMESLLCAHTAVFGRYLSSQACPPPTGVYVCAHVHAWTEVVSDGR